MASAHDRSRAEGAAVTQITAVGCALLFEMVTVQSGLRLANSADLEARWRREYPLAAEKLERIAQSFSGPGYIQQPGVFWRDDCHRRTHGRVGTGQALVRGRKEELRVAQGCTAPSWFRGPV